MVHIVKIISSAIISYGLTAMFTSAVLATDRQIYSAGDKYISVFLGGNLPSDIKTDTLYNSTPGTYRETYTLDQGVALRAAIGRQLNDRIRGEIEFGFTNGQQGKIREVFNNLTTIYPGKGDIRTYTAMANIWLDLLSPDSMSSIVPYIGGGIGAAVVDTNLTYANFPTYGPQNTSFEFAGQLGGGINWKLNDRFDLGIGYRLNFINGPKSSQRTSAGEITTYKLDNLISHLIGVTLTMKIR